MSAHTPGERSLPHFADPSCACKCAYVLSDCFAGSICEVTFDNGLSIHDGGNDGPPLEQAIANARLIAAAPDLLAALVALHAVARVDRDEDYAAITDAAIAIQKATGDSHDRP